MEVQDIMTREVHSCREDDFLDRPVRIMWENSCGVVPVVDAKSRPLGILSDRDVAFAALHHDKRLREIPVREVMERNVVTCRPHNTVSDAEEIMRENHIRRLPVVDPFGVLLGILSLDDIAQHSVSSTLGRKPDLPPEDVGTTLEGILRKPKARILPRSD